MKVDKILNFMENELGIILMLLAIVVGLIVFLKYAWKAKKKIDRIGDPEMSGRQARTADDAVKKLERAQKLLMEGDENLEEAIKLRDEVTNSDLPPVKVFIKGENPKSLLLDINRRIDGAKSRGYVKEVQEEMSKRAGEE